MAGYVDIHAHVLPGIDDGPPDLAESLALLRAAAAAGTRAIAATPHLHPEFPDVHVHELADRCQEVRAAIAREGIEIRLICAAEVSLLWAIEASEQELRLASYDQRGTDLLIETPSLNVIGLDQLLFDVRAKGFRVTLAHPERNPEFQRDPNRLEAFVQQGVLLQVNASTLLDAPRRSPLRRLGEHLCTNGLAHALASDGHRASSWRPVTRLAQAAEAAAKLVGADRARWLTEMAPAAIIAGEQLPPAPPAAAQSKPGGRFRRWLSG